MTFLKKNWWKFLAIMLLLYTLIFSLLVPLGAGVNSISPKQLKVGENKVILNGYNTKFIEFNDQISISVEYEKQTLACAENILALTDNQLSFDLDIPNELPSKNCHLRISTSKYNSFNPELIKVYDIKKVKKESYTDCTPIAYKLSESLSFPHQLILNETIRNLMFHVPMWFTMMILMLISFIYSIKYLKTFDSKFDIIVNQSIKIGLLFAALGLITGALWSKFTWNEEQIVNIFSLNGWWSNDPKLNGAAISTLIYIAYNILRRSIEDEQKKAKISAVYNIFAFVMMVVFLWVYPRTTDSLHPGNGGNPAFSQYDLDSALRMVFYPAVLGWILLGIWMLNLNIRFSKIKINRDEIN